ncbi:MAG: archaetidylserine decarboxylase [SAR324 cluster bacterium]|nr:archaetidylserine decarboxylase [SAR324 cluster bacterium]
MALPGFGRPPAYYFIWILPRNSFNRLCGLVADAQLPRFLLTLLIRLFSWKYGVNLKEASKQVSEYRNFNEFFTRKLLPDARTLDPDTEAVLSPVDGILGESGFINNGVLIQAKGLEYRLADLLKDPERTKFYDGGVFITIYLAPYNYHRIHSMVTGEVREFFYIPGDLWTVSPLGVHHVPGLFARNERLITYFKTEKGECALVKIGATVVGRIRVVYHDITSNRPGAAFQKIVLTSPFRVERGDEVGLFELGSTVICLFPPGQIELNELKIEQEILLGQAIGRFSRINQDEIKT